MKRPASFVAVGIARQRVSMDPAGNARTAVGPDGAR